MQILKTGFDLNGYFRRLANSDENILLLDYDGTLAPFRAERDQARPYPGTLPFLEKIMNSPGCRIVIISGRRIADLLPLLGLKKTPEIWGSHGWERLLPDGTYKIFELPSKAQRGLELAEDWAKTNYLLEHCEKKIGCFAIHWRGLDKAYAEDIARSAETSWRKFAADYQLEIRRFDGGLELRSAGRDKGSAVKEIISENEKNMLSYMGDDDTDEDAFAALRPDDLGVLVNRKFHPSAAALWLKPPDELLGFLKKWAACCRGKQLCKD